MKTALSHRSAKRFGVWAPCLAALFALGESVARLAGVTDAPIFRVNEKIGYYPAADQQGRFLNEHGWAFNDRSMGVAARYRWSPDGVLLVGDSVVYGGNPLDQSDKVGPLLAKATHRPVWPLAAGGWALENELQMLDANPDLLRLPTIVWVSNTGDFGAENAWPNSVTYPDHRPWSALVSLLRRTVLRPHDVVDSPTSPAATARWKTDLRRFLERYHGRLIWVLYPKKNEVGTHPVDFEPLLSTIKGRADVLDLSDDPAWRRAQYRDAIHPSADGDRVMASEIARALH